MEQQPATAAAASPPKEGARKRQKRQQQEHRGRLDACVRARLPGGGERYAFRVLPRGAEAIVAPHTKTWREHKADTKNKRTDVVEVAMTKAATMDFFHESNRDDLWAGRDALIEYYKEHRYGRFEYEFEATVLPEGKTLMDAYLQVERFVCDMEGAPKSEQFVDVSGAAFRDAFAPYRLRPVRQPFAHWRSLFREWNKETGCWHSVFPYPECVPEGMRAKEEEDA